MEKKQRKTAMPIAARSKSATPAEFNPDYTYVVENLKRIGILAIVFIGVLIALSFVL